MSLLMTFKSVRQPSKTTTTGGTSSLEKSTGVLGPATNMTATTRGVPEGLLEVTNGIRAMAESAAAEEKDWRGVQRQSQTEEQREGL